jgi:archaellum biogenesis protein FlaJ (TadC family)
MQLESADDFASAETQRRMKELAATEQRSLMLMRALRHFYAALSGFALAALLSLLGAVLVPFEATAIVSILEVLAVTAGAVAVGTMVKGSVTLVRETRIAVKVLCERAEAARTRIETLSSYQSASEREIA